ERSPAWSDNPHPMAVAKAHCGKFLWHRRVRLSRAKHDQDCNERESDRDVLLLPLDNERLLRQPCPFEKVRCQTKLGRRDPGAACAPPFHREGRLSQPELFPKAPYQGCIRHLTSRAAFARLTGIEQCPRQSFLAGGGQDRDWCGPSNIRDFLSGWCAKVFQYPCKSRLVATSISPS